MTDLNKERELFEATRVGEFKNVEFVVNEHWPEGHYVGKTSHYEDQDDAHYLSQSWYSWIDRAKIEAKAQAVPNEIINKIQSWVAVKSFAVEDAHPDLPIIDANELAEFIEQLVKSESGAEQ